MGRLSEVKFEASILGDARPEESAIDIFPIKILCLLMCRDTVKVKAKLLINTIIGREALNRGEDTVSIDS